MHKSAWPVSWTERQPCPQPSTDIDVKTPDCFLAFTPGKDLLLRALFTGRVPGYPIRGRIFLGTTEDVTERGTLGARAGWDQ